MPYSYSQIEIDEILSVKEAKELYPEIYSAFYDLIGLDLPEERVAHAVSIAVGICPRCKQSFLPCGCHKQDILNAL